MTGANIAFLAVGTAALLAGGAVLVRPALGRALLGLEPGEAATYGLRLAGAMIGAFGLALIVLTLGLLTAEPVQ